MVQPLPTTLAETIPQISRFKSTWTIADENTAIKMYMEGATYTDIAHALHRTLGQVAGKLSRRGVLKTRAGKAKSKPEPRVFKSPINYSKRLPPPPTKVPRIRLRMIHNPTAVTMAELEPHHCRWGMGDPRHSDFRFCGVKKWGDEPYCHQHCLVAYRSHEVELADQKRKNTPTQDA